MSISDIKVWPLKKSHPKIKANVQFVVDKAWKIKGTLMNGENGLFVGLPGKMGDQVDPKTGKKPWWPDVDCISKEARKELNDAIVREYNKLTGNAGDSSTEDTDSPQGSSKTNIPFG